MPCDSIQQSQVEFLEKSTDTKLLTKALEAMGYHVVDRGDLLQFSNGGVSGTYEKKTGKITSTGYYATIDTAELKRQYSGQVVEQQAKKFGWNLSWSTNPTTGNRQAKVLKRS
jgi:hypothetical protein